MTRFLTALCALALVSASALADGPPYRGSKIAADAPTFSWTGFYFGAGAGASFGDNQLTLDTVPFNFFDIQGLSTFGWKGDLKAGLDYRFSGTPFVLGVFGTWTPDGFGDHEFNASAMDGTFAVHGSISPTYALGARLGLVMANNNLIYVGPKYQWAEFSASLDAPGPTTWSTSKDIQGWGGVAGIEMPLTMGPVAATFGIEYGYQDYDRFTIVEGGGKKLDVHPVEHSVMGRLNIRTNFFGN